MNDDLELIQAYQAGHAAAFDTLFNRYKHYVYRVATMILASPADAEEATQDTFINVFKALPRFKPHPASFKTWLYRVTVNTCLVHRRRPNPAVTWSEVEALVIKLQNGAHAHYPEEVLRQHETNRVVWRAINSLSEPHRLAIILRYFHDLSYHEIAQVLECSEGTVKSRLYHAHHKLAELLSAEELIP